LALIAPDGTITRFSKTDCERRTVRAPLIHPAEGVGVEPYEAGQYFVGRASFVKLTSPASEPAARAEPALPEPAPAPPAEPSRVEPVPPPAPKKRSRKKTTRGGAQIRRAKTVLDRIFPEGKYHGRYPDEDEMAWPDVWDKFCKEYSRYAKECPSKLECPSQSTVRRVMGRAE
jgi:hypothetical protein